MEDGKDIELRSEAVQEVMGHVPSWIVRWGITVLSLVVLMLVVGSFFFRYPAGIDADREFGEGPEGAARDCPFQQLPGSGVRDRGGACVVRLDGPAGRQLQGGDCLPRRTDHQLRNLSSCGAGNESHGRNRNRRASFDRAFLPTTEKDLAGRNVSGFPGVRDQFPPSGSY